MEYMRVTDHFSSKIFNSTKSLADKLWDLLPTALEAELKLIEVEQQKKSAEKFLNEILPVS